MVVLDMSCISEATRRSLARFLDSLTPPVRLRKPQKKMLVAQTPTFGSSSKPTYPGRRAGFVKGYALIEFGSREEAQAAIDDLNGKELLTKPITVTWAFSTGPLRKR